MSIPVAFIWLLLQASLTVYVHALGQATCVEFQDSTSVFPLVSNGIATPILASAEDWGGVHRTIADFSADIERVTSLRPTVSNYSGSDINSTSSAFIVGTLGNSSLIDEVISSTGIDVSSIDGQWEAFMGVVVANPLHGLDSAYVMIGSDKRGTIYGLYELSEQIAVSPWYWWADVPTTPNDELYILNCSHGHPTVQYRAIFLNDEQPALQNWAMAKFTNGTAPTITGTPFVHQFYEKIFELILRLRGNFLWPAMWSAAFAVDDRLNQPLANYYGVVMGTSHQEPMMRAIPNEWDLFGIGPWNYSTNSENIYDFWVYGTRRAKPYESVYTIGMRGDGDIPLSVTVDTTLLEKIVSDQTQILTDVYTGVNVTTIPQVWFLRLLDLDLDQEVEGYYDDGMRFEDYVTLLWTDDNWGNIRRYPLADERNRSGGAGVYYHLDLVGDPQDYKWITSSQISKIYEQMSTAVTFNATRVWVLNVGDLKPYERETEFFLTYGYDASVWNLSSLDQFVFSWAQREFDFDATTASTVVDVVGNLTRYNARRKPELLNSTTYSLINYREADTVLYEWDVLENASTSIYDSLADEMKPAYFQLVHHPVLASSNLGRMLIYAGQNNLRAEQACASANDLANAVERFFDYDFDLETEYHTILNGEFSNTYLGYYYWQQPMTNTMPAVNRVQPKKLALAGVMRIIPEGTEAAWPGDNQYQCSTGYNCPDASLILDRYSPIPNIYIDVGAGGPDPFNFTITCNTSWVNISSTQGSISPGNKETRVFFSVNDWEDLAVDNTTAQLTFTASAEGQPSLTAEGESKLVVDVYFVAYNPGDLPDDFSGFVEGGGVVSIEAAHFTRNTTVDGISWTEIPGYGKTLSGVTPWPRVDTNFTVGSGPSVEYDFYLFSDSEDNVTVTTYLSPSFNSLGDDRPLAYAIQLDDDAVQRVDYIEFPTSPGEVAIAWGGDDGYVANAIVTADTVFSYNNSTGVHTLKIWMIEPTVVIQKVVVNLGGLLYSYLGPPESISV
ncbi:hypothetical protein FISHEDRAFT_51503 [Fistulina hepatica ATCC 64428]|uniref:Gylcosyl hydrolase 115 C-terminal domain-containing protein n=1 Tax=Fistulina hepatica ATCC 64428 TaxID=1128425 RepID=A0A0D6ZZY0_9AGAR|nr:hypothetical protein FISHEDRAFT_51503 [Fistulina hepatica ATCC 64428]